MNLLSSKETFVLNLIAQGPSPSQREIAKETGLSLGLINVILKKLLQNGYIQVSPLNKRKLQYLVSEHGLKVTVQRKFENATHTIRTYKTIQSRIAGLLKELHQSGYEYFSIHGDGELKELTESTFFSCLEEAPVTLGKSHQYGPRSVVLNLTTNPVEPDFKGDVVNVVERLSVTFPQYFRSAL